MITFQLCPPLRLPHTGTKSTAAAIPTDESSKELNQHRCSHVPVFIFSNVDAVNIGMSGT